VLQVLFFVSPIIWIPQHTQGGQLLLALNPISYLLAVSRDSIMSRPVPIGDWFIVLAFVGVTVLVAAFIYSRYRRRVVFWT